MKIRKLALLCTFRHIYIHPDSGKRIDDPFHDNFLTL